MTDFWNIVGTPAANEECKVGETVILEEVFKDEVLRRRVVLITKRWVNEDGIEQVEFRPTEDEIPTSDIVLVVTTK